MKYQSENKTDKEDLKWVSKTKNGNTKAFEKLVLKYQKRIYYAVRKIVLNHDDTNDIVQDTFVKAFSNLHQFDEQFSFYPWLHRIAINTTLNFKSKTSRLHIFSNHSEENDVKRTIQSNANPLEEVIETEFKEKVDEALKKIPLDQRIVFMLRTFEDLSYQEISEQLDISIGTVMSRLSRARTKLKELLQT